LNETAAQAAVSICASTLTRFSKEKAAYCGFFFMQMSGG